MSNYEFKRKDKTIKYGFDGDMDYVFIVIYKNEEKVYSNIDDLNIDFTCKIDSVYFNNIFKKFDIELPEDEKIKVLNESRLFRKHRADNLVSKIMS